MLTFNEVLERIRREPEEFCCGVLFGFAFIVYLKWLVFLSMPLCGLLWSMGGMSGGDKLFRRLGVPLTLYLLLVFSHEVAPLPALIGCVVMYAALSLGYGIPSYRPENYDEGSVIGRFWWKLTGNNKVANLWTRATVGWIVSTGFIGLSGGDGWLGWAVGSFVMTVGYPVVTLGVE